MGLSLEIARIVLPVAIVGGIGVFVILRMKHKYKKGTLGKKKTIRAQVLFNNKHKKSILKKRPIKMDFLK